jgi:hypothetical protein
MPKTLTIMVSSTVYGIEDLLDQIFGILSPDFEVWMSHKGTMPIDPQKSNFENCIAAVDKCDLFLGILTTKYGSGKDKDHPNEPSITHTEILHALKRKNLPRWFLAQHNLVFARGLVAQLGYDVDRRRRLKFKSKDLVDDPRVFDMYDAVIQAEKKLKKRRGNWAQPFATPDDAKLFVISQFHRYADAVAILQEQSVPTLKRLARTQKGVAK